MQDDIERQLRIRLGDFHAKQRLGIENSAEPRVFGGGINFFHPENWYSIHAAIRYCLMLSGLYWRGRKNTRKPIVKHHTIKLEKLPKSFHGYRILHLSDIHIDMDYELVNAIAPILNNLDYDICVLTGDYRARTFGSFHECLSGMENMRKFLKEPVYGVLGNHDSIRMVPSLEAMGIKMLINEHEIIEKNGEIFYLVGIDDAHYFRVDNIEKAAKNIPSEACRILLSHTPEIYRQAAYADIDFMLCGHTHGGQICLPGGIPMTLDSDCPRYMGKGAWQYHQMKAYTSAGLGTSIVNVRLNCPPEITIHTLEST